MLRIKTAAFANDLVHARLTDRVDPADLNRWWINLTQYCVAIHSHMLIVCEQDRRNCKTDNRVRVDLSTVAESAYLGGNWVPRTQGELGKLRRSHLYVTVYGLFLISSRRLLRLNPEALRRWRSHQKSRDLRLEPDYWTTSLGLRQIFD